jgi:hypothetical protein
MAKLSLRTALLLFVVVDVGRVRVLLLLLLFQLKCKKKVQQNSWNSWVSLVQSTGQEQ